MPQVIRHTRDKETEEKITALDKKLKQWTLRRIVLSIVLGLVFLLIGIFFGDSIHSFFVGLLL